MKGIVSAIYLALLHLTVLSVLVQSGSSLLERKKRHTGCGQINRNAPGNLASPNYPDIYPNNKDCHWTISTTEGKIISIKFIDFDFEIHSSCEYDYLEIYDGESKMANKLGRFCGGRLPGKYTSSGSNLYVFFHTDAAVVKRGFKMQYSASYGCDQLLTEDSGEIVSPNHPGQHPQPIECNYIINVTSGMSIFLTFEEFKLENPAVGGCEYDYIQVFDGPSARFPSLGKFCGDTLPSVKRSSRNNILIRFVADSNILKTGFRIKYYAKGNQICNLPAYPGNCKAVIPRWFYNTETRTCEIFFFGGCNSNGNNFATRQECQRQCTGSSTNFNECSRSNGGCDQACHNTLESYFCSCWKGHRIGQNGHTCEDVDECSLGPAVHHCEQGCTNMRGTYYCTCAQGFRLSSNRRTCNDINECLLGGACQQECINTPGSYKCECFKGYEPISNTNSKRCRNINECDLNLPDCHKCTDFEGGYRCECDVGFVVSENKTSCLDVNECFDDNGGCSQLCVNQPGNYSCQCKEGFHPRDPSFMNCDDIDECFGNNGKGNCEYECENSIGSFNCSCQEGYQVGEDKFNCDDIDECKKINNNGGCTQKCVNLPSSYRCECHDGYEEIAKNGTDVICQDIDECSIDGAHQCDRNLGASCVNEIGNYSCICPSGYYSDWKDCIDVDECDNVEINYCQQQCNNTPGSFHCTCLEGFSLNQDNKTCADIDECAVNPCDHICINTVGSFFCLCDDGFYLSEDEKTCIDVNECEVANGTCDQICINTNGSFKCECRQGYNLLEGGIICSDIDECSEETSCCDSFCTNKPGGYTCSCLDGHFLSRDNCTCQDTNECSINNGGCDHICNNTKGGFSCSCRPGYEIDPTNVTKCLDIDECLQDNGGCSQYCNNSEGSYECSCKPVYRLGPDGKICDHCPTCETFETLINDVEKLRMEVQLLKEWKEQLPLNKQFGQAINCRFNENIYENRDHWKVGDCRSCYCERGQVICFQDKECFQSADSPIPFSSPIKSSEKTPSVAKKGEGKDGSSGQNASPADPTDATMINEDKM